MHDCFECVDVRPLLPGISAPVLLLSGDNSPIASAQQKALAETLPTGVSSCSPATATALACCRNGAPARPWDSGDLSYRSAAALFREKLGDALDESLGLLDLRVMSANTR
jgi:hypothetical protein